MLTNITQPLKRERITKYYREDFKFLTSYLLDFNGKLDILVNDYLKIFYQKHCISTIALEYPKEKLRLYKIALYLEYLSFPFEETHNNGYNLDKLCRDFRVEDNTVFSVIVGPEMLHWWCHQIIWKAANVIGYKSLH